MSYFSEKEYKIKSEKEDRWFEELYFNRWFHSCLGPILDIGCATGNFMAINPEIIEGVEIDEDCYQIAKGRGLKVLKLDVETQMGELVGDKYQGIFAKHVIEHLNDPLDFLKQIKRILQPGGRAIIMTPNCPYMLERGFYDDYTHRRPFTAKSLKMAAYDAGWKNIKVYEDFRCFTGLGFLMRTFKISSKNVRRVQNIFLIRGLSLILDLKNE